MKCSLDPTTTELDGLGYATESLGLPVKLPKVMWYILCLSGEGSPSIYFSTKLFKTSCSTTLRTNDCLSVPSGCICDTISGAWNVRLGSTAVVLSPKRRKASPNISVLP